MKKFLRVVPAKFTQIVVSIEMFFNLKTMTVEELTTGRRGSYGGESGSDR